MSFGFKIGKFGKRPFGLHLSFPGPSRSAHPVPSHYLVPVIPGQPQVLPFRRSNTLSWFTLGTPKLHGRPPRKGSMRPAPGFPDYPRFVHPDGIKLPAFAADPPESYLSSAKSEQVVKNWRNNLLLAAGKLSRPGSPWSTPGTSLLI